MERAPSKRLAEFGSPRFCSECLSAPRRLDPLVLSNYIRQIVAMKDDELELFVDDWMSRKKETYAETEIWAGSGDKGRDVVGYLTTQRHDGPWHLFQCKQLKVVLRLADVIKELGKVFYHSAEGSYPLPEEYFFVAPRGVARPVQELIASPAKLRAAMIEMWDDHCAKRIVENATVPMTPEIAARTNAFDFSKVHVFDVHRMLKDPHITPALVKWFDYDPGDYTPGKTPPEVQVEEEPYLRQLMAAYGERSGTPFTDIAGVLEDGEFSDHLWDQRTRYFHAAYFKRHYRDNTPEEHLDTFVDEIYYGVIDTHRRAHADTLTRIDEVMAQAANVRPSGILARYARVPVRQGVCHHFANEGRLPWKR
jgi:hypothetical protein